MQNPRGAAGEKLREVLDFMGLSADEKDIAEKFYMGETKEIPQFTFSDLSVAKPEAACKLVKDLARKNRTDELVRLFLLAFARGKSTCYRMFTMDNLKLLSKGQGVDTAKLAAVCSEKAEVWSSPSSGSMGVLFDVARHSTKTVRQALEYVEHGRNMARLVLLATYFRVEYQNRKPFLQSQAHEGVKEEKNGRKCGNVPERENMQACASAKNIGTMQACGSTENVGIMQNLAENKAAEAQQVGMDRGRKMNGAPQVCTKVEAQDMDLLAEYEKIIIENFAQLYFGCVSQPTTEIALQELADGVKRGVMPEKLLPLVGRMPSVPADLHRLTAGLSYWSYMLSDKLKNIVKFCLAIHTNATLEAMRIMSMGISISIEKNGGEYDEIFEIDTKTYLRWVAKHNFTEIMKKQYALHPECYLKLMKHMDVEDNNRMMLVLKQQDPEQHKKIIHEKCLRAKYGNHPDREKVIDEIVPQKDAHLDVAKAYLRGEGAVETLYPYADAWKQPYSYLGGRERFLVSQYMELFRDEEFFRRCEVYMLLKQAVSFFPLDYLVSRPQRGEVVEPKRVTEMFADFAAEGVGISWQLSGVFMLYDRMYQEKLKKSFLDVAEQVFAGYLKEKREETIAAFAAADAFGRYFALRVLQKDAQENKKEILVYVQDSAKMVKQELFDILCAQRGWEEDIKALLSAKKAAERELAVKVLVFWQEAGADFKELFAQAAGKEKNAKVKALLERAMNSGEENAAVPVLSREELVKELHKGGKKRGLAWAYETPFPVVHMADDGSADETGNGVLGETQMVREGIAGKAGNGSLKETQMAMDGIADKEGNSSLKETQMMQDGAESGAKDKAKRKTQVQKDIAPAAERAVASEEYLQAILLCYSCAEECGTSKKAAFLAESLDAAEFAVYVNELFEKWMAAGAEAKKRWVLYAAAIHGGAAIVEKLHAQIKEWPAQARGAIACDAVRALSLNPLPQALLIVDGIARKFKFKQVRAAAGEALEFAADQLGITREELEDRIVPDFGFDENMERVFDYGERRFIVTLTTALEVEVFEAAERTEAVAAALTYLNPAHFIRGKKLKTFPAPGKKDDAVKAAAAYEEFKQLKKQMKAAVSGQRQRLEMALSTAREWDGSAWERLFVKNPLMHQFATGLVWGIYEDGKLVQSFRYMEDGSFNTKDGEEFEFPRGGNPAAKFPVGGNSSTKSQREENPAVKFPGGEKLLANQELRENGGLSVTEGIVVNENVIPKNEDLAADGTAAMGSKTSVERKTPTGVKIGLVHPVELTADERAAWKEQFEDYEIVQPFAQLDRAVYTMTKEEADTQELTRFKNETVNDLTLGGRLLALGWYRGPVEDAGCFATYYREDKEIGFGVELHFSGSYVGGGNEDVTIYGVRFYPAGTAEYGYFGYDAEAAQKAYFLRDIPARYFSEIVWQLTKAVC